MQTITDFKYFILKLIDEIYLTFNSVHIYKSLSRSEPH